MTAYIVRIESGLLRCLLWTLWFPVIALELGTTCALLGVARLGFGILHVACQLVSLYLSVLIGIKRRSRHE